MHDFFSLPVTPLVSNKDIPPPPVTHRPSTNRYVTTPTSRSVRPPPVVTGRLESKGSILVNYNCICLILFSRFFAQNSRIITNQ